MNEQVTLYNMFPDYEPPEGLDAALSQAAIVAADIHMEERAVHVALHRDLYIPQRLLNQAGKEIARLYGLRRVELTATHPEDQLHCVEPEELMELFVSRNSMTRGSLAGAKWTWDGPALTIQLVANGKKELEELIPQVQSVLRERFAAPVTITVAAGETLEGKALFDAMDAMRQNLLGSLPAGGGAGAGGKQPEAKAAPLVHAVPYQQLADALAAGGCGDGVAGIADVAAAAHVVWVQDVQPTDRSGDGIDRNAGEGLRGKERASAFQVQRLQLREGLTGFYDFVPDGDSARQMCCLAGGNFDHDGVPPAAGFHPGPICAYCSTPWWLWAI